MDRQFSESPTSRHSGIKGCAWYSARRLVACATNGATIHSGLSTGPALPTPAMTLAAIQAHGGQPPSRNPGRGMGNALMNIFGCNRSMRRISCKVSGLSGAVLIGKVFMMSPYFAKQIGAGWYRSTGKAPAFARQDAEWLRSAFQTPRLAGMAPFGIHDVPCQTPHAAGYHTPLDASTNPARWYLGRPLPPHQAPGLSQCVGHGPLSSVATASPIRTHCRARSLPDRNGTR